VAEECFFLVFQAWVTKTAESSFALISINSDTVQFGLTKNILFCKLRGLGIDRGSFDRNSLDRNCHFSVDQKF
jgi:hypothetical protein